MMARTRGQWRSAELQSLQVKGDEPNLRLEEEVYKGDSDYQDQPYVQVVCRQGLAPLVVDRVFSDSVDGERLHRPMCAGLLRERAQCAWWEIIQEAETAVCVYERPACSTREVCQRVSDVGLGRSNAWWDRYEERWRATPVEEQLNWLQHCGAMLVDGVLEYEFVVELNIELAEANMRGFMERVDVLSKYRAPDPDAVNLAMVSHRSDDSCFLAIDATWSSAMPSPDGGRSMLSEMPARNAAASSEGSVPAENIRWVALPDGIGRALCVAYDWGASSAGIWQYADYELRCVVQMYQLQECTFLDSESIRRRDVVRQAFTGTGHEREHVAEAWTHVPAASGTKVWAFGLGWNKKVRTQAVKAALAVHVSLQTGCSKSGLDRLDPLARQSAKCVRALA